MKTNMKTASSPSFKRSSGKISKSKAHLVSSAKSMYRQLEGRVNESCNQLELLNRKISGLKVRHQRASKRGQRPFSESIQMQLDVYEGLYATYYAYTAKQAHRLAVLETALSKADALH